MTIRTRIRVLTALLTATLPLALVPSAASARARLHGFDGTCLLTGTGVPARPVTLPLAPNSARFTGAGTCTGTLDGRSVTDTPITVNGFVRGELACFETLATGRGAITFTRGTARSRDDAVLRVVVDQTPHPLTMRIEGAAGGDGVAPLAFTGSSPDLTACAGDGVKSVTYQAVIRTVTPLRG